MVADTNACMRKQYLGYAAAVVAVWLVWSCNAKVSRLMHLVQCLSTDCISFAPLGWTTATSNQREPGQSPCNQAQ